MFISNIEHNNDMASDNWGCGKDSCYISILIVIILHGNIVKHDIIILGSWCQTGKDINEVTLSTFLVASLNLKKKNVFPLSTYQVWYIDILKKSAMIIEEKSSL